MKPHPDSPEFVFLIGAARSGTKFLRDLLSSCDSVASVPFDVNYVWRYQNESLPDDRIPPGNANPEISRYIHHTLEKMARRHNGRATPIIIEKSVSNVLRVPFIHALFPQARFIHLLRDGRDVALSAARQWENPSDVSYLLDKIRYFPVRNARYAFWYLWNRIKSRFSAHRGLGIWGPRYPGIEADARTMSPLEIAAKQWSESASAAGRDFALLPERQKFTIRYEDLVGDSRCLLELVEFLNLPDAGTVVARYDDVVQRNKSGAWRQLPRQQQSAVLGQIQHSLRSFGYID